MPPPDYYNIECTRWHNAPEKMTSLLDKGKEHTYYQFANEHFEISKPVVFVDDKNNSLVDPINIGGIDVQGFHPATTYWMDVRLGA